MLWWVRFRRRVRGRPCSRGLAVPERGCGSCGGVEASVVEARAEVVEGRFVVEQVPSDDQDGAPDRDDGSFGSAAADDAPVAFTEECIGSGAGDRDLPQDPGQVAVSVPGRWGGEADHVHPISAIRTCAAAVPTPGIS